MKWALKAALHTPAPVTVPGYQAASTLAHAFLFAQAPSQDTGRAGGSPSSEPESAGVSPESDFLKTRVTELLACWPLLTTLGLTPGGLAVRDGPAPQLQDLYLRTGL